MPNKPSTSNSKKEENSIISQSVWGKLLERWISRIKIGSLTLRFPSGLERKFCGSAAGPNAKMTIKSWKLIPRLIMSGDVGLAESFMAGEWDTPDLTQLILLGDLNEQALGDAVTPSKIIGLLERFRHFRHANSRRGSKRNIAAHYDLGNDFYSTWLDKSMSYSSALFKEPAEHLEAAQRRKYIRLAKQLDLKENETVLEIGCGWGGFAEIAAREFKCKVVGITLSTEQAAYAADRMRESQVSNLVDIRIEDYRDVQGKFDKIVSIEMLEAVGAENWRRYFEGIKRLLKPDGKAAIQTITINDKFFDIYRRRPDFIQKYIFPGGVLPNENAINDSINVAGLQLLESHYFGTSYAETLRRWHWRFEQKWTEIKKLGFDERFQRMWSYYLSYCEAGFETGHINVGQFLISSK